MCSPPGNWCQASGSTRFRSAICWSSRAATIRPFASICPAHWKNSRSKSFTKPTRYSWFAHPKYRACTWPARDYVSCAVWTWETVKILLNRAQRHTLIPITEVEKLLELPVYMSFPNDYVGVHKAITAGKQVNAASELGAGFRALAESIRSG